MEQKRGTVADGDIVALDEIDGDAAGELEPEVLTVNTLGVPDRDCAVTLASRDADGLPVKDTLADADGLCSVMVPAGDAVTVTDTVASIVRISEVRPVDDASWENDMDGDGEPERARDGPADRFQHRLLVPLASGDRHGISVHYGAHERERGGAGWEGRRAAAEAATPAVGFAGQAQRLEALGEQRLVAPVTSAQAKEQELAARERIERRARAAAARAIGPVRPWVL